MRSVYRWLFGAVGLCAGVAGADDARDARLEAGETVVEVRNKGKVAEVQVSALFDSKPDAVWGLVSDCNKYTTTMLRIKESKEISRSGGKIRCRTVVSMPWPLDDLKSVNEATLTVTPGKKWQRKWKFVEGDFVVNEGTWTLTPHTDGKRTRVVYRARTQPKADIPEEIRAMAQRKELPKLFRHLKDQLGEP